MGENGLNRLVAPWDNQPVMTRLPIPLIQPGSPPLFPSVREALIEPNGLLAVGGDLGVERLLAAYAHAIFPWFGEGEPIMWWSPDPRCVFRTDALHVSRSLRRHAHGSNWTLTTDRAFSDVIRACAAPRDCHPGTWIIDDMIQAYTRLHALGHAHSIEIWDDDTLVGGLYGVMIGRLFCGESMFSARSDGSKVALLGLCRLLREHGCPLLDAQVSNPHLLSMGATLMPRTEFVHKLDTLCTSSPGTLFGDIRSAIPISILLD